MPPVHYEARFRDSNDAPHVSTSECTTMSCCTLRSATPRCSSRIGSADFARHGRLHGIALCCCTTPHVLRAPVLGPVPVVSPQKALIGGRRRRYSYVR